jgi:hypothetical protein
MADDKHPKHSTPEEASRAGLEQQNEREKQTKGPGKDDAHGPPLDESKTPQASHRGGPLPNQKR